MRFWQGFAVRDRIYAAACKRADDFLYKEANSVTTIFIEAYTTSSKILCAATVLIIVLSQKNGFTALITRHTILYVPTVFLTDLFFMTPSRKVI